MRQCRLCVGAGPDAGGRGAASRLTAAAGCRISGGRAPSLAVTRSAAGATLAACRLTRSLSPEARRSWRGLYGCLVVWSLAAPRPLPLLPQQQHKQCIRQMALVNGDGQEAERGSTNVLLAASAETVGNESKPASSTRSSNQSKGKTMTCRVVTLSGSSHEIEIPKAALGQELFDAVVNDYMPMHESAFFSLSFEKLPGTKFWLNMAKRIEKQLDKCPWVFFLEVKFYPPDPNVLSLDETRYQLTLQVRQDILTGRLSCSFYTYALLGSYTAQSELGDFDIAEHGKGIDYLRSLALAPGQSDELLECVADLHRQHKGLKPAEAELLFLDVAKKLALYGVSLYKVKESSKDGDKALMVGVSPAGLYVYDDSIRINAYTWPRIHKMSYKHNVFQLKIVVHNMYGKTEEQRNFKCLSPKLAKRLWLICVETHQFFRLKQSEHTESNWLFTTRRNIGMSTTLYQLRQQQQQQDSVHKTSRMTVDSTYGSTADTRTNGSMNAADYLVAGKGSSSGDTDNIEDSFTSTITRTERENSLPLHASTPEKRCPTETGVDNLISAAAEGIVEATEMLEPVGLTVPAFVAISGKDSTMVRQHTGKGAQENSVLGAEDANGQALLADELLPCPASAADGELRACKANDVVCSSPAAEADCSRLAASSDSDSVAADNCSSSSSLPLPTFSLDSFGVGLEGQLADGSDDILTERHEKFSTETGCSTADPSRRMITVANEKDAMRNGDADDAALLDAIRSVINLDLAFVVDRIELEDDQNCKDV